MIQVLLIEDDPEIARVIRYYLGESDCYETRWASNAADGLTMLDNSINVVLLDIMLPDADGIALCSSLREKTNCPIIFISCLDDSETIIKALEQGGDDYITKPFNNSILDARIRANIRRVQLDRQGDLALSLSCGTIALDAQNSILTVRGKSYRLPPIEFKLLSHLMLHPGVYFKPEELYHYIWGKASYGDTRTVIVHICNLRRKIEENPAEPRYIKRVWGKGYLFDANENK